MRKLRSDEPVAVELTALVKAGDVERLRELLAANPGIAACIVEDAKGGGRTPLHLFADWPGHNANPVAIVAMLAADGADLDAPAVSMWHKETPLHWAASCDDVELADALLNAGADIEHEGSSIDGGPPLSCAVGYGQWEVARRLVERGAQTQLWHEAALGMLPAIIRRFETDASPAADVLAGAFWNACHGGELTVAEYLLERGADLNWATPWSGQTPLDIAENAGRSDVVTWLRDKEAVHGKRSA